MTASEILLRLIGSVALLLWGLRMVQTGVRRAFGSELRKIIQQGTRTQVGAFVSGLLVTMLVQSSTATALITASFSRHGFLALPAALAVMLGADVGTTLVAQLLSLDLSIVPYLLFGAGLVLHRVAGTQRYRQLGRVAIGMGLMLLALRLIMLTAEPLTQSQVLHALLQSLASDTLLSILVAAILAWLMHSSLATVLLIASFVSAGMIPIAAGVTFVLGANLGGTIGPIVDSYGDGAAALRLTIGNAFMKIAGILIILPLIPYVLDGLETFTTRTARLPVNFHTFFNLGVAVVFLPFVGAVAALMVRFIKEDAVEDSRIRPQFLDESALDTPNVALICASREVMRMTEYVETMLRGSLAALQEDNLEKIDQFSELDDVVDELYRDIKFYVTQVSQEEMTEAETERSAEILLFTTNLEHIGDIVENILSLARKRVKEGLLFSDEGLEEVLDLHRRVIANFNLATSIFMSGDVDVARQLIEQKREINILLGQLTQAHLDRLRAGLEESMATSSLHLDILRDLRRVHSHITAIAYPVLDRAGELRKSRLKKQR